MRLNANEQVRLARDLADQLDDLADLLGDLAEARDRGVRAGLLLAEGVAEATRTRGSGGRLCRGGVAWV